MADNSLSSSHLLAQIKELNSNCLYASAASLGSFITGVHQTNPEVFVAYGDSLFGLGEHKRALAAYRTSYDLSGGSRSGSSRSEIKSVDAVEIIWKMAECQRLTGDYVGQKQTLEGIRQSQRTIKVHVALGNLYRRLGGEVLATACFQDALAQNPLCVEVIDQLAQMNVKEQDLTRHMSETIQAIPWLADYVTGTIQLAANDHKAGQKTFQSLSRSFPESTEALAGLAVCHMEMGNNNEAAQSFEQVSSQEDPILKILSLSLSPFRSVPFPSLP